MKTHLPEVTTILVPEEIADLPRMFETVAQLFDRLEITSDDRARVDMMRQEIERRELAQKLTEGDFLASLGLEVRLFAPAQADLARVTQLLNKTNQFNVTTRRYSLDEVRALCAGSDRRCDLRQRARPLR